MESNPTCPLCYTYPGVVVPQQTPQYFYQNQSPNIVINPTFSFITNGPPAKKPKISKECITTTPIRKSGESNKQSSNENKQGSSKITQIHNNCTGKDKPVNNSKKSSWASDYLQSIGQSQPTASLKMKKPIVCIPDYGKNSAEFMDQTLVTKNTPVNNEKKNEFNIESTKAMNNRVNSLLSNILPLELEQKKSGIKINFINNDASKGVNCIDKSESKLIAQSVTPSISTFRIPKLKINAPKDTDELKIEKGYGTNNKTNKNSDELKHDSVTANNFDVVTQNSKTKPVTSIQCLKTKANHLSNPFKHQKRMYNVKVQTENNEKRHQNIQKEDLYKVCKFCNHSERLTQTKTEKANHLNKTEQTLNEKLNMSTKSNLNVKVKEEQSKKDRNLNSSIKQKYKSSTLKNAKLKTKTETDRISRKNVTCQIKTHFTNMRSKVVNKPKSPIKYQDENGNQPKHAYRSKMQNPHNNDMKAKIKKSNEGRKRDEESKSSRNRGSCNLYREDIKKTKKEDLDDNVKNISNRTTVKSIINPTNKFDLKFHKNNDFKKYPVVEDLRKKLNRVKKRDILIVSVPNTIHKPDSVTEQDQAMQNNPKESTTKTIKLVINLICDKARDKHFEENVKNNETCQLASLDLSFLDDINVDDIVESLNYEETANKNTNIRDQAIPKLDYSYEAPETEHYNKNENEMAPKHESTSFTISKTSGKTTEPYRYQEGYNKIIDDLTLLRSNNIKTKTECAATVFSPHTNLKQVTFNKINEYHRSEIDNIQMECEKEIKGEIIVLSEEQTIDTLFFTNNDIKKGNDVDIKTEITKVSLEPLSNTHSSITTQHSSNSNQGITFDTKFKDSQITKKIHERIKNEMITEIIVLDDDDDDVPIRNSAINSNNKEQEKEFKEEIIVLDEEQLMDTSTLKANNNKIKESDTKIKNEITQVNEGKLFDPLNTLSAQNSANVSQVTSNKITENIREFQIITQDSHRDKNELITEIIVLDEDKHIFNTTIDSSVQQTSHHHIITQNQQALNKPQTGQHIACKVENTEIIKLQEESVTDTVSNCNIREYCNTICPDSKNTLSATINDDAKLQQINDNKTDEPEPKQFSTVSRENQLDTENYYSKNNSKDNLPPISVSTSGSSNTNKADLAIKEDTVDVLNIKSEGSHDNNQNESHDGSVAQNVTNSTGKINESKTRSLFVTADKYKATGETFCKQQVQDVSLPVVKINKIKKTTTNPEIKPVGLVKVPCEELLMQNVKERMFSYLGINYDLELLIRRGKFSTIFQCEDAKNKTTYAVKIINKEQDRYTQGIQKETMLKDLQKDIPKINQHFVYLFNGFGVDGRWCFLMEYYPKNLKEIFDKTKECFHIDTVQELSRQLVSAVIVLRNKNIVHSAIKPGHVLINDTMNSLKLCGFDEARNVDQVVLLPNLGTPSYRAPELILGYSDGFSIDIWSTALVMYEMATGRKLFPGMFNNDILYKQLSIFGDIPFDMVQSSIYKDHHFRGTHFMRKCGYLGKDITFISGFDRKNIVAPNIFTSYYKVFAKTRTHKENLIAQSKLRKLIELLHQMLILDPQHRLPIEFVYADPFIFKTFDDDCLLRPFEKFS